MNKDYSLDALNKFLEYTIDKGILKAETAKSRRVASNKILEKLGPEERADLRLVNLDVEADRFANRQGGDYLPASLQVYKSRARSALTDFFAYVDNPMTFKPAGASRAVAKANGGTPKKASGGAGQAAPQNGVTAAPQLPVAPAPSVETHDHLVFPIPIRPGLVVKLMHIPADLSTGEAEKIAQVVRALACKE